MNTNAYFLVFDGLADWELAHALCEINKSGRFEVVSVGFAKEPVTTMGGLNLRPDITLDEVTSSGARIFKLLMASVAQISRRSIGGGDKRQSTTVLLQRSPPLYPSDSRTRDIK
jgi:hypothetical protein